MGKIILNADPVHLRRINPKGMRTVWQREIQRLEIESKKEYPGYPNAKRAAIMRMHIQSTVDANEMVKKLLNTMFDGAVAYYEGVDRSEFFYTSIKVDENHECYPEIYFEDISDRVVSALGRISDIIVEKYKGARWFELEMLKTTQPEYDYGLSLDSSIDEENPFGTKSADFCM